MGPVTIEVISVDESFQSYFSTMALSLTQVGGMFISERQQALNFRHRRSEVGYESDWHVAGDPTLIIVLQGTLELELRNGDKKQFSQGQQFIAADYLPVGMTLAETQGHRARVIGDIPLQAVHIKLSSLT